MATEGVYYCYIRWLFILEMPVPAEVESPKVDSELKSKLESFDKSKLKTTKTEVKNTLPSKEGTLVSKRDKYIKSLFSVMSVFQLILPAQNLPFSENLFSNAAEDQYIIIAFFV